MSTPAEIAELRLAIKESADAEPYTDELLGTFIDSYGMDTATYKLWRSKLAAVANLVDMSEGGSSRKMSQLFDHYTKIVASYAPAGEGSGTEVVEAPRTRKIERI